MYIKLGLLSNLIIFTNVLIYINLENYYKKKRVKKKNYVYKSIIAFFVSSVDFINNFAYFCQNIYF